LGGCPSHLETGTTKKKGGKPGKKGKTGFYISNGFGEVREINQQNLFVGGGGKICKKKRGGGFSRNLCKAGVKKKRRRKESEEVWNSPKLVWGSKKVQKNRRGLGAEDQNTENYLPNQKGVVDVVKSRQAVKPQ